MENSLLTALYPIQPKLVHFPIALMISAMGMQGLGMLLNKDALCRAAWVMFVLAVFSIPIVILSGLWEAQRLNLHHPILETHKKFAFTAMWVALVGLPLLWFIRTRAIKIFQIVFLVLLIVLSALLALAAHQGGRMVYEYGVGISRGLSL